MLNAADGDEIKMELSTPTKAGIIKPVDKEENEERMNHVLPHLLKTVNTHLLKWVSKHYKKIIRDHCWHVQVNIRNNIVLKHIVNNYNFKNLNISRKCDINKYIHKLRNCHIKLYHVEINYKYPVTKKCSSQRILFSAFREHEPICMEFR